MSNINKSVSQFSYSCSPQSKFEPHPQHRYFKLYDKYTSQASSFTFDHQSNSTKNHLTIENNYDMAATKVRQLQMQNQSLREEMQRQKNQISQLKYELYYCNEQLHQITYVEANQYKSAINDLRLQIQNMLEKDKITQQQLNKLKIAQSINALPKPDLLANHKYHQNRRTFNYHLLNIAQKENILKNANVNQPLKRQDQTNSQFLNGLKDMYSKIMGYDAKSLKQLWKWIKEMGQIVNRLRRWSKKCRQFIKSSLFINTSNIKDLLDEAMIIIN